VVVSSTSLKYLGMPASSPRHADDPRLIALGKAIQRARGALNLSQEELAHRSAIDRSYMSGIERGKQNPGIVAFLQVADALEITAAELLSAAGL
jgi:transcriptional regulator with XRE-family HTH domain